ncbi:MAG: relaxase/mobilization nuclease domain-containing protein [Bacteroidales bacterium]|nr:relaxase/mobilization nuclease domain-containing protein [Bacteroidales bacterium]
MVIKIHQTANTENALLYNERKVQKGVAEFFDSRNTLSQNPFSYNEKHRLKIFSDIEQQNPRVKNKCLHISINPTADDYLKMGDIYIKAEINNLLKDLGYGKQPYFVYKHEDLDRVHFHAVSTRVDKETGKKISDSNERKKVQQFIKTLEQKYNLTQNLQNEIPNLKFTAGSNNLKQNLQELFIELNRMESIINRKLYDRSLGRFNVEIRRSGRGHVVFITDGNGNPVRYPICLSEFEERPRFYVSARAEKELQIQKPVIDKFQLAQWARDLNRLVERNKGPGKAVKPKIRRRKQGKRY